MSQENLKTILMHFWRRGEGGGGGGGGVLNKLHRIKDKLNPNRIIVSEKIQTMNDKTWLANSYFSVMMV